ncbi:MAG: Spo0B domain-containing protein, partial [Eubacteriales bacterium]
NLLLFQGMVVAVNFFITYLKLANFVQIPMLYISRATLMVSGFAAIGSIILLVEIFRLNAKEREADLNALRLEESRQMLDDLSAQTHDFLNHIQVVYGMAQLGLRENLASYVNELVGGIEPESRLNKSAPLELAAFLIKKSSFVKTLGIKLDIEIEANLGGLRMPPPEMVRVVGNLVNNAVYALVPSGLKYNQEPGGEIRGRNWFYQTAWL